MAWRLSFQMAKNVKPLPKWMLKTSAGRDKDSLKTPESVSSNVSLRKTVYFLSEKELLDTAKEILKQSGREESIERLEKQKEKKSQRNVKISEEEKSELTTSSSSPYKMDTDSPDIFSELSDSTSSDNSKTRPGKSGGNRSGQNSKDSDEGSSRETRLSPAKRKIDNNEHSDKVKRTKPDLSILDEIFS